MDKYLNSFDNTQIYYNYSPQKNPFTLVFLHGVGGNWTLWKKEIEYFQQKGYSTLALDLRGHGASQYLPDFASYRLYCFSRDVHYVLKKENINNFSLIGHSIGGGVAINYLMRYKSLYPKSLVLVDTAITYPFDHNHLLNMNSYFTKFLRFIANYPLTVEKHLPHLKDIDLSVEGIKQQIHLISHLLHFTPLFSLVKALDNLEQYVFHNQKRIDLTLSSLKIPTLIISGEKDETIPMQFSKHIKELKKDAQLKIIKEGHHRVIVDKYDEVSRVMQQFFVHKVIPSLDVPHNLILPKN